LRPGMFDDDYMTEGSNGVEESWIRGIYVIRIEEN
jgi:hypothetical protein